MEKNSVYLLVTDLHLDFVKANRINYFGEILGSMDDIMSIAKEYIERGYVVNQILLGDVFDSGMSNPTEAMQAMEVFRFYCDIFNKTYAVVGNHEITYSRDNPFWFFVSDIKDASLSSVRRYIQPRGLLNTVEIPERIVDGDVTFYFNHYGTPPKVPEASGVRIGVFHQNVGSNDICKMWGTFDNVEEASYIQGYNYCFFGHMHLAKGVYYLNEAHSCVGEWLGTIGRTKVTEIIAEDCKVDIPAIVISNGKFQAIERNYIELQPPIQCIDQVKLTATQNSHKAIEEYRKMAEVTRLDGTLHQSIKTAIADTPMAFLFDFLDDTTDNVLIKYRRALNDPLGWDGASEEE